MHFAFNFPLEKIILWKNIIKYDKNWSFLLIIWDKENRFFLLIIWDGGSILLTTTFVYKTTFEKSFVPKNKTMYNFLDAFITIFQLYPY